MAALDHGNDVDHFGKIKLPQARLVPSAGLPSQYLCRPLRTTQPGRCSGSGFGHRFGRNGDFCLRVDPVTSTAGVLVFSDLIEPNPRCLKGSKGMSSIASCNVPHDLFFRSKKHLFTPHTSVIKENTIENEMFTFITLDTALNLLLYVHIYAWHIIVVIFSSNYFHCMHITIFHVRSQYSSKTIKVKTNGQ